MNTKTCSICNQVKPVSDFSEDNRTIQKIKNYCCVCECKKNKEKLKSQYHKIAIYRANRIKKLNRIAQIIKKEMEQYA